LKNGRDEDCCLEGNSFSKGYISKEKLLNWAKPLVRINTGFIIQKIANEKFLA